MSYFKPLRRKIGVVTLILVCLFAGLWLKSGLVIDKIVLTHGGRQHRVVSDRHGITWSEEDYCLPEELVSLLAPDGLYCVSDKSDFHPHPLHLNGPDARIEWRRQWLGFDFGELRHYADDAQATTSSIKKVMIAPFQSVVIPLTLLSAWLLLSKSRRQPARMPA